MKTIFAVVALAALTGCAVQQPYYTRAPVADPYQWHTVSSQPVYSGGGTAPSGTTYTEVAPSGYTTEPVYAQQQVYVTQPVYYAPAPAYYYPPVSIGLDFGFGGGWCCGHGRGWGGRGRYHR